MSNEDELHNPAGQIYVHNIYTGRCKDIQKLIDTGKILGIISNNSAKAIKAYAEYDIEDEIMQVMDIEEDTVATSLRIEL